MSIKMIMTPNSLFHKTMSPLLALLAISVSLIPASFALCNEHDKQTLLIIRDSFGSSNPPWHSDIACCDWPGIDCDADGHVTGMAILENPLVGPIPSAIGDLHYLQVVRLHKLPNLYGTIPPEITKLSKLRFLTISWTGIYGSVPAFLAKLTALEQLDLSFNKLSGFIPSSLGDLPKLYSIDISRNNLTGTIPASLFHKVPNSYLLLSHNNLTGPIPRSFQEVDFTRVDLSRNKLTGDASVLFGRSKSTQSIDLSRNKLTFDLSNVKFPEAELISLELNHNMIYGSIPKQITKVPNLQGFNVSYNRLCGEIPRGGKLGQFDKYSFFHNKCLCGPPLAPCA
ncbi:polygalacturonase inhibitor-like [Dioscorea cayenensis subsp. rotundata]|uniref:Polygalacturonase inhibitor-like n=1 Tax=Dioscorea cayennensis subsp. rotundata TaxID=55577 RepID=A0AB40BVQ2_DIOCR|nr:polygalacturonase inhibitor-like [Dioscorea cayenensis subsp. rotundata]